MGGNVSDFRVCISRELRLRVPSGIWIDRKRRGKKNDINIPNIPGEERNVLLPKRAKPKELVDAPRNVWLFMSMFVVIVVLSVGLYMKWRPDRGRYDNDLKHCYVLMKGEASPKRLSELEVLFETERDQRAWLDAKGCRSTNGWYAEGRPSTNRRG